MLGITFLSGCVYGCWCLFPCNCGFHIWPHPLGPSALMGSHCSEMHPTPGVLGEVLEHYSSPLQLPCTLGHLPGKVERPSGWLPPHALFPYYPTSCPSPSH